VTPHKQSRGKSFVLDRQFKGVGRIKRASGTDSKELFALLDAMLTTLYKAGRLDVLRAIHAGQLHTLEVWSRYRLGELDRLPSVDTMKPLRSEMERWVDEADTGQWNRQSRRYGVRAVLRLAKKSATIQDLPDLLRAYSRVAGGATMFNRARAAVQAFLRDTLGKSHPLYARVRDVGAKRMRTRQGNPQSPEQLVALTQRLTPAYASIAWAMALTGMGPAELWGEWTQHQNHIYVRGMKRAGRKREIPLVHPIARPTRQYRAFRDALVEASDGEVQPYDLRRTYARWMDSSGISRIRRKIYLGHSVGDVTDLYERHEIEQFWIEDAERVRAYLASKGVKPPPQLQLVSSKEGLSA
jgi:integrase